VGALLCVGVANTAWGGLIGATGTLNFGSHGRCGSGRAANFGRSSPQAPRAVRGRSLR